MKKILIIVFLFSLSCIFIINFIWSNTPEFWEYGNETGVVISGLSMSFVAAYIFYLLDVVLPKLQRKKLIDAKIVDPGILIIRDIEMLFEDLIFLSENKIEFLSNSPLSKEYLTKVISNLNIMESKIPYKLNSNLKESTIFESMLSLKSRTLLFSKQITSLQEIDLKLFLCIQNIENTSLWRIINQIEQIAILRPEIKNAFESSIFIESLYELQLNKEELKKVLFNNIRVSKVRYEESLIEDERIIELRKKFNITN
ncbi:hypothetical protein [Solibacillus sp. FSL W8-0372]|uniref:hypothetical protein n=1 Tax=Solibacillus sp. FSL W8-0372 TaxID=2921713 RepID=UPI0030D19A59